MNVRRVKGKKYVMPGDVVNRLRHVAGCYGDLDEKALLFEAAAAIVEELRAIRELLDGVDPWEGATRDIARRSADLEGVER